MHCPSCSFLNAAGARFCGGCGRNLTSGCPYCAADIKAGQRFCPSCGGLLDTGAPSTRPDTDRDALSERRLVSVLFLDLVDFTALAEGLDPEDVARLQSSYFALARSVVDSFGGTLEKFIGDAVMAVWGAPQAHEDDARRAVRAALELTTRVAELDSPGGTSIIARAAVASGEAAVSFAFGDGQGLVSGDLVNTAARLQQVAPAGGVLIDATTRRLLDDGFRLHGTGPVALKGKLRAIDAWRVVAAADGTPVQATSHPGSFVGREKELDELVGLYRAGAQAGQSRLISILGIAGIGKSRLAWEFQRRLVDREGSPQVYLGSTPAYGQQLTFAPLAEVIRQLIGGPGRETTAAALEAAVGRLASDDTEREWLSSRVSILLEPVAGGDIEREDLFTAWRRLLERASAGSPVVLILEDLHWADEALLDFVEHLTSWARDFPILVLSLARPELLDRRPTWGAQQHAFTALQLAPLPDEAMAQLVAELMPALPAGTVEAVVQRAGGVPLYGVEMARMLRDEPHAGLALERMPETLHALVAARIDALPLLPRRLLLAAAVLGGRFDRRALDAVAPAGAGANELELLLRRQLLAINERDLGGGSAERRDELSFVQEVVRDVAYRTLARADRRRLHLAAADQLAARQPSETAGELAGHLLAAHDVTKAGTERDQLAGRALTALRAAAAQARSQHSPASALAHHEHALALVTDDETRLQVISEAAADARDSARFEKAEAYLRELIEWYDAHGRRHEAARARANLASLLLITERHQPALKHLNAAVAEMGDLEDDSASVELEAQLARSYLLLGENEKAVTISERSLDRARRLRLPAVATDALITRGTARVRAGSRRRGIDDLRRASAAAARRGFIHAELRARNNLAWLMVTDDPSVTVETARAGLQLARLMGVSDWALQLAQVVSAASVETGQWDLTSEVLDEMRDQPQAPAHRIQFCATEVTLRALQGDQAAAELLGELIPLPADTDAQIAGAARLAEAWLEFCRGDLRAAHGAAADAAQVLLGADRLSALALAARCLLWQRDLPAAGELAATVKSLDGRVAAAHALTFEAGLLALQPGGDAGEGYERALAAWARLELPLQRALCQLDRARLAGAPVEAARSSLADLGARGLLSVLPA